MKRLIYFLLMCSFCFCYADDFFDNDMYNDYDRITWFFFNNTLTEYKYTEDDCIINNYNYLINENGPYYIMTLSTENLKEEYIVLYPSNRNFLLVYDKNSDKPMYNGFFSKNKMLYPSDCVYTASSYLKEGDIQYSAENLENLDLYKPWVEGKIGPGIGEKITITSKNYKINALVISNGYVSRKQSTYYNNNRVKQIRVTNKNNPNEFQDFELPDNANPIELKLTFITNQIEIKILSVYPGEKYDDTCINFILCKGY